MHLPAQPPFSKRCVAADVFSQGHQPGQGQGWHQVRFGQIL